jgi:hypothetical protein
MARSTRHQADERPTLLCLSHLRWDHVWKRPQQLMTRLTRRYRVWYVDPPELCTGTTAPELRTLGRDQGVRVMRSVFAHTLAPLSAGYWSAWHALLPELLARTGETTILWAYSPYVDQLVARGRSHIRLAVYDCMDDLTSFKDGSAEMHERKAHLRRRTLSSTLESSWR